MQPEIRVASPSQELALGTHKVLRNTYMLLGITLIPTVIGAFIGLNSNFSFLAQYPIMGPLLMLAAMMGLLFGVSATRNSVWGIVLLLAFTFIAGWWLGPMLQAALNLSNGAQLVGMAAGGTALIFFSLAGFATITRKDFSFMGKFLFIGLIMLVIAAIANLFFAVPAASLAISAIAIMILSAYILYDVSRIIHGGETNYVMATMALYLDIYNIFVSLLHLLMAFSGRD